MIVWIVSYPRSGNSLTRQILKRCFGTGSYSYPPTAKPEVDNFSHVTGSAFFAGSGDELLAAARADAATWFVKTHLTEAPREGERLLYVVRDARAAMASFRRFQRNMLGREFSLEQIVQGKPPLPSWSAHADWALARPAETTLLLRYEALVQPTPALLDQISGFIGLPALRPFDVSFEQVRALRPQLCEVGRNGPGIEEIEANCPDLFWTLHGETMRRLGYEKRPAR